MEEIYNNTTIKSEGIYDIRMVSLSSDEKERMRTHVLAPSSPVITTEPLLGRKEFFSFITAIKNNRLIRRATRAGIACIVTLERYVLLFKRICRSIFSFIFNN